MKRSFRLLFFVGRIFSPFYSVFMMTRSFMYKIGLRKSLKLSVPVISIGNLTLGGTGKTPLVMYVVRYMLGMERKPVIVSRGYGGTAKGEVNIVSDGHDVLLEATVAGDEPRLLAETLPGVPVLTGPKRAVVGKAAIDNFRADTIVLDDGFQHLSLQRDLDLVLFNARTFLGDGWVFPGGELREPFSALKRAHGYVITGVDAKTKQKSDEFKRLLKASFPQQPVFMGEYLPVCLLHSKSSSKTFAIDKARRLLLYGFAGIADPDAFKYTLGKERFKLVGFQPFKDHHNYTAQDVKNLIAAAREKRAQALITTEKDFVKLKPFFGKFPVLALKIELFMEGEFDLFLNKHLQ